MRLLGRIALFAGLPYAARAGIRAHNAPPTVVILVRHADKAGAPAIDPPLTAAGSGGMRGTPCWWSVMPKPSRTSSPRSERRSRAKCADGRTIRCTS
jgi:hypothetical protein